MTSLKKVPTLKGVFPVPQPPPKRDFLRENKLKLKDLQEHNQHISRRQQQFNNGSSEEFPTTQRFRNSRNGFRSETRSSGSTISKRLNSGCSCSSGLRNNRQKSNVIGSKNDGLGQTDVVGKRVPSILKQHCDRSVQTDDIIDEKFLSSALQKCSTKNTLDNPQSIRNIPYPTYPSNIQDETSVLDVDLYPYNNNNIKNGIPEVIPDHYSAEDIDIPPPTNYSQFSRKSQQHKTCGAQTDFGSRREIKIPKYLEREKREKELQRIREMERDPQCPEGHYVLNEKDRKDALEAAEKQFKDLVDELNRMPMSSATLRIRNRKNEIEKALIKLENNIKTFSKQKVYVKMNE